MSPHQVCKCYEMILTVILNPVPKTIEYLMRLIDESQRQPREVIPHKWKREQMSNVSINETHISPLIFTLIVRMTCESNQLNRAKTGTPFPPKSNAL